MCGKKYNKQDQQKYNGFGENVWGRPCVNVYSTPGGLTDRQTEMWIEIVTGHFPGQIHIDSECVKRG